MCPHHVGHWLGMDVHDTPSASRSVKLQPNQVICIEPGMLVTACRLWPTCSWMRCLAAVI